MKIRTNVKAGPTGSGGYSGSTHLNHNEKLVRGLKIKSSVKAGPTGSGTYGGSTHLNHNETLARGLKVRCGVKAGGPGLVLQHNETMLCGAR